MVTALHLAFCPHVLKYADIRLSHNAIFVTLWSTKMRPLSAPPVVFRLPALIVSFAMFGIDKGYMLHSLRRGAAQACQGAGLSLGNIMAVGTW